uniref:CD3324 family protein n=1 Tax=Acetatifactor sp. TaxID=1872090 RepID=UPI004056F3F8
MKYTNAIQRLPQELLEQIQEYVQGEYLYIPVKDKNTKALSTDYKTELERRNAHIYTKYLEGVSNRHLSQIYNLSESSIRRIILRQRGHFEVMTQRIKNILEHWDLSSESIKQIYDTAWQVGEEYILKVYNDFDMLERNLKMLCTLEKMNIPVGRIVLDKANELYVEEGGCYYFLAEKLQGNNLVNLKDASEIAVLMGEIIADLHLAFLECEKEEDFWDNSLLGEMKGWVRENLEADGWKYVEKEQFETVVDSLEQYYEELPVQLIHRDVHFGNFLFDNGKFSGYIDFDLSQRNIRIFDLCYFLLGLLSEEEKLSLTKEQWFDFVVDVFQGYEKKISLLPEERTAVPYVMECIELLFVAYFAGIDDNACAEDAMKIYKFVRANEERVFQCINE